VVKPEFKKGAYSTSCWLSIIGLLACCIKFLHLEKGVDQAQLIILAAGEARRFGTPKQLALFNGRPMLQHVIEIAVDAGYRPWVALGANCDVIRDRCSEVLGKSTVVEVEDWRCGLAASIRAVVEVLLDRNKCEGGAFIMLGDQPWLTKQHIQGIADLVKKNPETIICADYAGAGGVPAYFPESYLKRLASLEGDRGAKQLIAASPHICVSLGEGIKDVDTPEDLTI
jgi:molybdenum cofactor cytidylyltransferase